MLTPTMPEITIGIPAYNTGTQLESTLQSVCDQSFEQIKVLINIEPTPEAEETLMVARRFACNDPRITVTLNPKVLGWAENIRQLQMKVETPYFMILPHDDALHPECLGHLHQTIESHPNSSVAFPHIYFVGNADGLQLPTEHQTDLFKRMHDHFVNGGNPEFWKALTRTSVLKDGCSFPSYGPKSFSAEYEWAATLLSQGRSIADPRAICYKRIYSPDNESVSNEWIYKDSENTRSSHFIEHGQRMKDLIGRLPLNKEQHSVLLEAYQATHWWRMLELNVDRYPLPPAIREQIARQNPSDPATQKRLRLCELRCRWIENQINGVIEELQLLIDSDPINHDAQILLMKTQLRQGDFDAAVLQMNRLEQLFPNSWRHREVAAWLASELKKKYARNNTP